MNKTSKKRETPDTPISTIPSRGKIHAVVIFPFAWRRDNKDLRLLYTELVARLAGDSNNYARPITVMDCKTYYNNIRYKFDKDWNEEFRKFLKDIVEQHSKLSPAWCVDTCQMWNTGLGEAFNEGGSGDVYWLIPGDFYYSQRPQVLETLSPERAEVLQALPMAVRDHGQDLCVGEISVDVNSSKQLIDTYGTYGLLYNWFPHEAQQIRRITDKPRTEFQPAAGSPRCRQRQISTKSR